jgi:L-fucose isomerase-like protein
MIIAAAEESAATLANDRGDALCGLLSAVMAVEKRGLRSKLHIPSNPIVGATEAVVEITHFAKVMKVVKGIRNSTIGLFGPRPRDFETCNYNVTSLLSIGVEVEEHGFFDLANEVKKVKESGNLANGISSIKKNFKNVPGDDFALKLAAYEQAVLNLRERLGLSGMATQCWAEQEFALGHVPCSINARMAAQGFPVACENDAYSLVSELMGQYATDSGVTILDINHSIPVDLHKSLSAYPAEDLVGLFHCGNTDPRRMKNPSMKHQVIMKRVMEPDGKPDISRGTVEGQIAASDCTVLQIHGTGDSLRAYILEGEFLDLDPKTFGATGTAYIPGFKRFYRHVMLGRFHHHAAIAFGKCGKLMYDAMSLLGIPEILTPLPAGQRYAGENPFDAVPAVKGKKSRS